MANGQNFSSLLDGRELGVGAVSPVRFIYTDEAGTSAKEPFSVVAAVIVDADTQWRAAESLLNAAFDTFVPRSIREGFVFHATEVFSGSKTVGRNTWPFEDRLAFMDQVVSIPRTLRVPIAIGKIRRDSPAALAEVMPKLTHEHHFMAFLFCMAQADKYLRRYTPAGEVATVVAEDNTEMRSYLRKGLAVLRTVPIVVEGPDAFDADPPRAREVFKVERIIDDVHFSGKKGAIFLQLADACAFSMRRFLAESTHGERLVAQMLGRTLTQEEWSGTASSVLFFFDPDAAPSGQRDQSAFEIFR